MFLVKIFTFVFSPMILLVAFLLVSGRYKKLSDQVDLWISTDPFFRRLDSFISIDRFLLNRLTGVLIFIGSFSYIMIYFLVRSELTGWLADVLKAYSIILALSGIFIGGGLMMGGKIIRRINDRLSAWVSTEKLFRPLDNIVKIDGWFYQRNILVGILLLLACVLVNLGLWLVF